MGLTYGFFDSINLDRVYNAEQFSSFFDGIIDDGVYSAVGNRFEVKSYNGMKLTVDTGRAWFDHTWTLNTTKLVVTIDTADTIYNRIDAVVLEVNKTDRKNYIKVLKGEPSVNPARPTLKKTTLIKQWALAYVTVPKNATIIVDSNIANVVNTSETPLASAINLAGIPSGGTIGQVLAKNSNESGSVGWYDMNDLPKSKWYLPAGISESQVIAAFLFGGAKSETAALRSVNSGSVYTLDKNLNPAWDSQKGFNVQGAKGLKNDSLANLYQSMVTVVICFSDVNTSDIKPCYLFNPHRSIKAIGATVSGADGERWNAPGFKISTTGGESYDETFAYISNSGAVSQGVLAVDFSRNILYIDGIGRVCISRNVDYFGMYESGFIAGGVGNDGTGLLDVNQHKSAFIHSMIFFNTSLSADMHVSLATEIKRMRGI